MHHKDQKLNEAAEIKRLYYKLSVPKSRSRLCFLLYLFIIPLFIVIGGVTFSLVELVASEEAKMGNAEICVAERKILMKKLKASMEDNFENFNALKNITYMWESIENTAIEIESCHRKRLFELLPIEIFVFRNALLYSFGVYTTIGYGNLFPRTVKGRLLTVAYAVVGIPLNVAFISDLGELIARTVHCALCCFHRHILNKRSEDPCIEYKKFSLILLIAFLILPTIAIIVMGVEHSRQWNYIDSLYYTFTTATLIGLGDFTPQPSYVQFFILIPLFFIAETLFALALGFLTHLYRYESVIMYKLIKHKISRFLLHRRLQHMKCTLQEESSRNTQELSMLNTKTDATKDSARVDADIDAEIAELSAREMRMNERIDAEMKMLEAVPSEINLGILNAQIKSDGDGREKLRHAAKKWLRSKEAEEAE